MRKLVLFVFTLFGCLVYAENVLNLSGVITEQIQPQIVSQDFEQAPFAVLVLSMSSRPVIVELERAKSPGRSPASITKSQFIIAPGRQLQNLPVEHSSDPVIVTISSL